MKKIEAKTLEAAYALATKTFECSLTALDCEIIQHPSSGFLGLFSKPAIIVVARKQPAASAEAAQEHVQTEPLATKKPKVDPKETREKTAEKGTEKAVKKPAEKVSSPVETSTDKHTVAQETVLESFFDESKDVMDTAAVEVAEGLSNIPLQEEIEAELKALIELSCFDIDVVEVDVIDNTAYVFIDGEDAALLIGKEGYRYNALSYLISNWLQNKHALYIKLEIAQFLASQQEMIRSYMVPVIEHVEQEGWGRTRALDGILVQIALEQLREEFPNKYVAIKRTRNGDRYVLINEFNKR